MYKHIAKETAFQRNSSNLSRLAHSKNRDIQGMENEVRELLTESMLEGDVRSTVTGDDNFMSNEYLVELLMLMKEILSSSGSSIQASIHQNYVNDLNNFKDYSSLRKKHTTRKLETMISERMKLTAALRTDLDCFCEDYNETTKPMTKGKDTASLVTAVSTPGKLIIDSLVSASKANNSSKSTSDPSADTDYLDIPDVSLILRDLYRLFASEQKKLEKEIFLTLHNTTMKPIKTVTTDIMICS